MPLFVGSIVTPSPPPPSPTPIPTPEPVPVSLPPDPNACILNPGVLALTDVDGRTWIFDGSSGIWEKPGRRGFHAPRYNLITDESPAMHGEILRDVRAPARPLFVPLVFTGGSELTLRALRRAFIKATSPLRGTCVLTLGYLDGTRRHIGVIRDEGMEGEEGPGSLGIRFLRYGLVLRALDPFWYGDEATYQWQGTGSQAFFPLPHSPTNFVNLLPGQVFGTAQVDNAGDVEAHPIWTVSGPATGFTAANTTTGKTLTVNATLATTANKRIIDTRPGVVSIVDETGTNRWSDLAIGSALWLLEDGVNSVDVTVSGASSVSLAQLRFIPRFEGS